MINPNADSRRDSAYRRYCDNLAAALFHGNWNPKSLRQFAIRAVGPRRRWLTGLLDRVMAAHAQRPRDDVLSAFVLRDVELKAAWDKVCRRNDECPEIEHHFSFPLRMQSPTVPLLRPVPVLETPGALAGWFGIPIRRLDWYADLKGLNAKSPAKLRHYDYQWLKKPGSLSCYRLLEAPKAVLKSIQRQILSDILSCLAPHDAAHGFCKSRSIATNAAPHCGRAIVARFDLRDFFPSIPAPRVAAIFSALGYPRLLALILAGLCTTRLPGSIWDSRPGPHDPDEHSTWLRLAVPHLPQGAPTSPALANLCAYSLDCRLAALARNIDATYTRYADDLTFSGGEQLAVARLGRAVVEIAAEEGFAVNPKKTRIQRRGSRQIVAGVVVNLRPNIPRPEYDALKAHLTNCVRNGPAGQNRLNHPDLRSYFSGRIAYVAMLNPARGRKLWRIFDRITWGG